MPMVQITIDPEKCDGCGICVGVCHKGQRIFKIEKVGNKNVCLVQDTSYCYGCTTCVSKCPKKAINLVRTDKKIRRILTQSHRATLPFVSPCLGVREQ